MRKDLARIQGLAIGSIIILILVTSTLTYSSCSSYKGNYSQKAYQYNKKYSKEHKTK